MFSIAHLHLLINHLPIFGSIFVLIMFVVALVWKNGFLQKLSLWFLVGVALSTGVTYISGEKAVSTVEKLPQVSDVMITQHDHAAVFGLVVMIVAGAMALGGIILYSKRPVLPGYLRIAVLVVLLVSVAVMSYIGFLGGQISHPEIRALSALLV